VNSVDAFQTFHRLCRVAERSCPASLPLFQQRLNLSAVPGMLAICRLDAEALIPDWVIQATFFSITRTPDELSIVIAREYVPAGVQCERGWRALRIADPLDFLLVGVLVSVCAPLAYAGISVFAISTSDTDYVLVTEADLEGAIASLTRHHSVA
jgi:hypothetical protein